MMSMLIMNMISLTMMFLKHPLSMSIAIILQTVNIAMMSGMMLGSFMMSYIIMIIMLSGMLVLFIYMASIASNEKFNLSLKIIFFITIMMITTMMITKNFNIEFSKTMNMNIEKIMLTIMFNNKNMIIMLVMYLLFSMITISTIVNITEGPLRVSK
uniref:NADH dehydrogenase subunit 6 n=1 Tax=Physopelta slanbuschii TaxID=1768093 RepID=A0A4Y1JVR5_9HEMI|nr:NADH dehydrogenase subunit 6 [Physopelta slanbuschii]APO08829.1 NADH dehydrogenase subunit 6 [Physopelta slanbuschii]